MASLGHLSQAAEGLLDQFATHLSGQGVRLPDRQYVSPTPTPVWDGEQFTVALMGMEQGQPGATLAGTWHPSQMNQFAQFSLSLVRVVSVLQTDEPFPAAVPSDDAMNLDGVQAMDDGGALWRAAIDIHAQYVATSPGESFEIGPLQTVGPEGGLSAVRLLVSLTVD